MREGEILIIIKVYVIHIIFYILCFYLMRYFEDIYIAAHTDLLCFLKYLVHHYMNSEVQFIHPVPSK